ncbi:MAG: DUF4404 family protein [Candidatus Eisenbacteria bacterium]|nr:DUF4404 family protein [Candidatus Eisenbacteria bacterium]
MRRAATSVYPPGVGCGGGSARPFERMPAAARTKDHREDAAMPRRQLRKLLDELDLELDRVHQLDDPGREKLTALRDEIEEVLERTTPPSKEEEEGIFERLRDARDEFAVEHPQLTRLLNRIAQTLSNLGI